MNIPLMVVNAIVTVLIYAVLFAVSYGKIIQKQKDTDDRMNRMEDWMNDVKKRMEDMTKENNNHFSDVNKCLSRLEGTLETFIKMQVLKEEMK